MKKLLLFLAVLLPLSLHAALPDYSVFRGTNEVLVTTNPSTGQVIIGPATPISQTASNAAKSLMVWTNDIGDQVVYVVPHDETNAFWIDQRSDYEGTLWVGRGAWVNYGPGSGGSSGARGLFVLRQSDIETDQAGFNIESIDSASFNTDNYLSGFATTNGVAFEVAMNSPISSHSFNVGFSDSANEYPMTLVISNKVVLAVGLNRSLYVAGIITNTALSPSKLVSTGSGTNLTSSAYGDSDIAGWLSRSNGISGYNNRIVQLKTNGTAVQTLPLGAIDLNIISSPTIGYQATNSAGENEIQFNATAALALTTDLTSASNALRTDVSNLQGATNGLNSGKINIQSGFANGLTSTNGTNVGPLTIKNATATRIAIFDGSQVLSNAPALTAGQYLTFDGTSLVASNLPASSGSSGPTTNAPPYAASITSGLGSTNILIDMLALGATNTVRATLTANAGIMFSNVIDGMAVTLELIQDSTGNRTVSTNATWGFNMRFGIDVTGFGQSTNASTKDLMRFIGSGTNALAVGNLRGFAL